MAKSQAIRQVTIHACLLFSTQTANVLADIYHSYLGLATLALMKEPGLKEVDPVLPGISVEAKEKLVKSIQAMITPTHYYWKDGRGAFSSEGDPDHAQKTASAEGPPKHLLTAASTAP